VPPSTRQKRHLPPPTTVDEHASREAAHRQQAHLEGGCPTLMSMPRGRPRATEHVSEEAAGKHEEELLAPSPTSNKHASREATSWLACIGEASAVTTHEHASR
jgi:hypothetical protein